MGRQKISQVQSMNQNADNCILSSDLVSSIDFTSNITLNEKSKFNKNTKKRSRLLYDSYLPGSKNIRIKPLTHPVKQCNCTCFIHNGENEGPNTISKTIQSEGPTKQKHSQPKASSKDTSISMQERTQKTQAKPSKTTPPNQLPV